MHQLENVLFSHFNDLLIINNTAFIIISQFICFNAFRWCPHLSQRKDVFIAIEILLFMHFHQKWSQIERFHFSSMFGLWLFEYRWRNECLFACGSPKVMIMIGDVHSKKWDQMAVVVWHKCFESLAVLFC